MSKKITQGYLKSILEYKEDDGSFYWKWRNDKYYGWNLQYAEKEAGCFTSNGYRQITINGYPYLNHRLAWLYINGTMPKVIDHADKNGLNNKICNLRNCDQTRNNCNKSKQLRNKSGFKGVDFLPKQKKWRAEIQFKKIRHRLGHFNCPTAAHLAYCKAARKYHGEFARLA